MPSLFTATMTAPLPLTPPEFFGAYTDGGYGYGQQTALPLSSHPNTFTRFGRKHSEELNAATIHLHFSASNPRIAHVADQQNIQISAFDQASIPSAPGAYGSMLSTLRYSNGPQPTVSNQRQSKTATSVTQPKEERMGGVAENLDYSMDEMVNFVSEMVQGMYEIYASRICLADIDMSRSIVDSKSSVQPEFRKYVFQILSSTRLPSSTILVGLHYLVQRMTMLSATGIYSREPVEMYHMLVTALLLGSKFMDDNTFQNRSWSEVSNIAVSDINDFEIKWLVDIKWDMHIDPRDPQGFLLWRSCWERFQTRNADMVLAKSMKQTHLEVDKSLQLCNQQPLQSMPGFAGSKDTTGDHTRSCWNTPRYDQWPSSLTHTQYSPPSAPETGPSTPSVYNLLGGFSYGLMPQPYSSVKGPIQPVRSDMPPAAFAVPYNQQYSQRSHMNYCTCYHCQSTRDNYFMASGHCAQAVAG